MSRGQGPTDEQKDSAALWLAKRTGGTLSVDEQRELEDWLNADPANRLAWDEMRVLWARLEAPSVELAAAAAPRAFTPGQFRPPGGWLTLGGIGAIAALFVWLLNPNLLQNLQADVVSGYAYSTPVALPDGSLAKIGADTALAFDFDGKRRHVRLLRGEAFFNVVAGSEPAFTIDVGGDLIRVVGTEFSVDRIADRTTVVVEHGKVAVTGARDEKSKYLTPGQQVTIVSGAGGEVETADLDASFAWISGRLVVRQRPVSEVLAELGRHTPKWLLLGSGIVDRPISGTFPLDDVDGSLDTIAAAMNATVIRKLPMMTVLF